MMLTVGQKLVFVPAMRRGNTQPYEVTVERVGRKWAYLSGNNGRIDENLVVDGGDYTSPGRCYGSLTEYEETTALHQAWTEFYRAVGSLHRKPDNITMDDIGAARRALRLC